MSFARGFGDAVMASMRNGVLAVLLTSATLLCGCSKSNVTDEVVKADTETPAVSITRETEAEISSRTRDVSVVSKADSVSVSYDAAHKVLEAAGFKDVELLLEGALGSADGTVAKEGDSAPEMVGWWLDGHERLWALHVVSGDVFASRVWLDETETADMIVCASDRPMMYNASLGRLVRLGIDELKAEGIQVVRVDSLDADTLGSVEA